MEPINYETFITAAFSLVFGKWLNRFEDPAGFADTGIFTNGNMPVIKSGVGYAMGVYRNYIKDRTDGDYRTCEDYIGRVMATVDIAEITVIIDKFGTDVINKHFEYVGGILQPK